MNDMVSEHHREDGEGAPLIFDTHVDIPWPTGPDFCVAGPRAVDLPKLRMGGVAAVCFAAYVPQERRDAAGNAAARGRALAMLDAIHAMGQAEGARLAVTVDEIEAAHRDGVVAIVPVVENGSAIGGDIDTLKHFAAKGVRYITLTHNGHNALADAAIPRRDLADPESEHGGLSAFGRQVISRMNALGMLVDVSHAAKRSMMQAATHSATPVVATHSCARALCDHPRNLDDEQLRMLRDTGGIAQITLVSAFLRRGAKPAEIGVNILAEHVDHVANLIGIDHVGIGTDFDGGGGVAGFMNASEAPTVTRELARRGYDREAIAKIWGGNFLRVLRAGEDAATEGPVPAGHMDMMNASA